MTSVIVVDDDQDTVEVFCEYLMIKGIDVIGIGHNGREAIELYQELKPDVVLSDVLMPDYDGFYALQRIREFDPTARVIMVTASAKSDTDKNKMMKMGATAVIHKPYEIESILNAINDASEKNILISNK